MTSMMIQLLKMKEMKMTSKPNDDEEIIDIDPASEYENIGDEPP